MICARCGTEHNDPNNVCPRCFYGRIKEKKHLPKWLIWLLSGGGAVIVAAGVTLAILAPRIWGIDDRWTDGIWEGDDVALIMSVDTHSFQLINGDIVLLGDYKLQEDNTLRLIDDEGRNYIYSYELQDPNTMRISFADGQYVVRATLERQIYFVE